MHTNWAHPRVDTARSDPPRAKHQIHAYAARLSAMYARAQRHTGAHRVRDMHTCTPIRHTRTYMPSDRTPPEPSIQSTCTQPDSLTHLRWHKDMQAHTIAHTRSAGAHAHAIRHDSLPVTHSQALSPGLTHSPRPTQGWGTQMHTHPAAPAVQPRCHPTDAPVTRAPPGSPPRRAQGRGPAPTWPRGCREARWVPAG